MWAMLAGRIPVRFLLSLAAITPAAGTIGIVSSSTLVGGLPAALALGVAVGGIHLLLRLTYADYYGRQHLGSIRGLTIGAQIGGQVMGPIIAGVTFDVTRSYWPPFLGFALAVSLAGLLVLAATPPGVPRDRQRD